MRKSTVARRFANGLQLPDGLASPLEKDSETYSDGSRNRPPGQLLVRSKRN